MASVVTNGSVRDFEHAARSDERTRELLSLADNRREALVGTRILLLHVTRKRLLAARVDAVDGEEDFVVHFDGEYDPGGIRMQYAVVEVRRLALRQGSMGYRWVVDPTPTRRRGSFCACHARWWPPGKHQQKCGENCRAARSTRACYADVAPEDEDEAGGDDGLEAEETGGVSVPMDTRSAGSAPTDTAGSAASGAMAADGGCGGGGAQRAASPSTGDSSDGHSDTGSSADDEYVPALPGQPASFTLTLRIREARLAEAAAHLRDALLTAVARGYGRHRAGAPRSLCVRISVQYGQAPPAEDLNEYEQERLANIADNEARIADTFFGGQNLHVVVSARCALPDRLRHVRLGEALVSALADPIVMRDVPGLTRAPAFETVRITREHVRGLSAGSDGSASESVSGSEEGSECDEEDASENLESLPREERCRRLQAAAVRARRVLECDARGRPRREAADLSSDSGEDFQPPPTRTQLADVDAVAAQFNQSGWVAAVAPGPVGGALVAVRVGAFLDGEAVKDGLVEAIARGLHDTKSKSRASQMVHRGSSNTVGAHTLLNHVCVDAQGHPIPRAALSARRDAAKPTPLQNLKVRGYPFIIRGDAPLMDAAMAEEGVRVWDLVRRASPALASQMCRGVPPTARGIHAGMPATAASAYTAGVPRDGTPSRGGANPLGGAPGATPPPASAPERARADEPPGPPERAEAPPAAAGRGKLEAAVAGALHGVANNWHRDWRDAWPAIIAHVARDRTTGLPTRSKGGVLLIALAVTESTLDEPCIVLTDGCDLASAVEQRVTQGGGVVQYPRSRAELRAAIAGGRAILLAVPPGAVVVAEANKVWHCVTALDPIADAELERLAMIWYAHGCVCDVKLALGACATLAEEAAHPALLRFQSAHAAREWRRRHAKILPAHLQPAPYAFDWAALLPRVSRPIPARAAPATAAAEYTNFTVGRRQVQVDLDGAARMLAEEAIARSTLGSWAYAARLTDPRSEVARLYEQWNAQHDQQFMPPLLPEDPRLTLIHKGLSDLAAGRWAAQSGRTRTHRALLALFLSSQIAYSGMVKLMGSDCGLLEVRESESERQLAERVQELLVFRQQQRSRRRLQPLPYQRKGGRKRRKAGAEPSTHDLEFAQAVRGICSLSALALESVHQAVVANKGAARAQLWLVLRGLRGRDKPKGVPFVGDVITTVMLRETRAIPWAGAALLNPPPSTVRFGSGPASRLAPFVHAREGESPPLSALAPKVAGEIAKRYVECASDAWDALLARHPEVGPCGPYIAAAHLASAPTVEEVENMLCEAGKCIAARAACEGLVSRGLMGRHEPPEIGSADRTAISRFNPLVPVASPTGRRIKVVPWLQHPLNPDRLGGS